MGPERATHRSPEVAPERLRLGELLLRDGVITPEQLEAALRVQSLSGGRLGQVLVALGHVDPLAVVATAAGQIHLRLAALAREGRRDPRQVVPGGTAPSPA